MEQDLQRENFPLPNHVPFRYMLFKRCATFSHSPPLFILTRHWAQKPQAMANRFRSRTCQCQALAPAASARETHHSAFYPLFEPIIFFPMHINPKSKFLTVMKVPIAALLLLSAYSSLAGAEEPAQKEESASTKFILTRPGDGGVFVDVLRNLRQLKDEERPFEWKEVDEKIDKWFSECETRFPEDFKKHAGKWDALREQSKRDARIALAHVNQAWKDSVSATADEFEASEADFYARKPTLVVGGTYRYFEGKRDRSGIDPSWTLSQPKMIDVGSIRGEDTHDTGAIILKSAEMNRPMFSLKCVWNHSLEAAIDPESLDARTIGSINTPKIRAWLDPRFNGNSYRKITLSWGYYDKSTTPIGPVKIFIGDTTISTSMELGTGFTYPALPSEAPMPVLQAGVNDPAHIK